MLLKIRYIAILSFLSILIFSACKETKLASDKIEKLGNDEPQLIFSNINTHYTENTNSMLKMKAKKQLRFQDGRERYPEGIYIEMYQVDGKLKSTLLADSAIYLPTEKMYRVMGNVVVENKIQGKKLESDLLNWNKETEEVFTDSKVRITADGQIITGKGLKAKQDFSEYEILDIEGTVPIE
jgi:LPS export ABC transporter protein LptC